MNIYVITTGNITMRTYRIIGCCTARAKAEQYVAWHNGKLPAGVESYVPSKAARIEVFNTEDIVDSSKWRLKK